MKFFELKFGRRKKNGGDYDNSCVWSSVSIDFSQIKKEQQKNMLLLI